MSRKRTLVGALVCWSVLTLPAFCQEAPPAEGDSLRQEIAKLRQLVGELVERIDSLERQVAQQRPDVHFLLSAQWQLGEADGEPPTEPRLMFSGVEAGMMIDAIEHRMRWQGDVRVRGRR